MSLLDHLPTRDNTHARITASLDDALHVIACERRRIIITTLRTHDPIPMRDLSRRVAATEHQKPPRDVTKQERKAAYISLYQTHLDVLETHDVIDWEHVGSTPIRRGPTWPAYHELLRVVTTFTGGPP